MKDTLLVGDISPAAPISPLRIWCFASLCCLLFAWPAVAAIVLHGPNSLIGALTGDAYHYLAIARKAVAAHIYTYDGVHVTNGFHPLWQYTIRGLFSVASLRSHESQAIAVMTLALVSATLGVGLSSAAVIRMTRRYFLGLLVVPGLFYLAIGVHVRTQSIWSAMDGMESSFSVLAGGIFFFVLSRFVGASASKPFDLVKAYCALGLTLPFLVLSRLDDVFIVPGLVVAAFVFEPSRRTWFRASIYVSAPTFLCVLAYLIYNYTTVGSAMPLSGSTKTGFVGLLSTYLTAGIHFPPIFELKRLISGSASDTVTIMDNAFRFIEMLYPLLLAAFASVALWRLRGTERKYLSPFLGVCCFIVFKMAFNFLNVHPWHQSAWYYAFAILCLSVLGACALSRPWTLMDKAPVAKWAVIVTYCGIALIAGAQVFTKLGFNDGQSSEARLWTRAPAIRSELEARGVSGLINVDDGITAFLLDLPSMHGFAFATDVEAQRAYQEGRMLTLALSRGINTIVGQGYMEMNKPVESRDELRRYLASSLAAPLMSAEFDQYEFSMSYFDPVAHLPFFTFTRRR